MKTKKQIEKTKFQLQTVKPSSTISGDILARICYCRIDGLLPQAGFIVLEVIP